MAQERLQKILSRAGFGSRRNCEIIISESRVMVKGVIAHIGMKADPKIDIIFVDGKQLRYLQELQYFKLNKPRGVISSLKPQGNRPTVRDLIPVAGFFYPIGRLDFDSEGLMLLTNDGELTQRLTHPRYEHEKEYHIFVSKYPSPENLKNWETGVVLRDGFRTSPVSVKVLNIEGRGAWLSLILKEGHKRQIREMGTATNLKVQRIIRIRIGKITLGNLLPGEWRELSRGEISLLRRSVELQ